MDLSKQNMTNSSMYFDAESSASTTAYKTLEAISDISNASTVSADMSIGANETLEAKDHVDFSVEVKSVPLRALPKNIMPEYLSHCSTPTKEQIARTVEIDRGSDAANCVDLRVAFRGADDDEKMTQIVATIEDNKENALPENCEISTISQSSSVGVVTVIDRNKEDEPHMEEIDIVAELIEQIVVNKEEEKPVVELPTVTATRAPLKPRRSFLPTKNLGKAACEPDLKTNRPSRISMLPQRRPNAGVDTEIPKLITKALSLNQQLVEASSNKSKLVKRTSLAVPVDSSKEPRILASATNAAEKRPYQYAQRMSTMVKTTLNSPARKIMRRSMMPVNNAASRRSMIPPPVKPPPPTNNRRSMFPGQNVRNQVQMTRNAASEAAAAAPKPPSVKLSSKITEFKCNTCNAKFSIKSLLDAHKRSHEDGVPAFVRKTVPVNKSNNNNNNSALSNGSNNNQCKFCDKKFALLRTLHIHLMENCHKIPPSEKRKLVFTEMQHVEKPQLPLFSQSNSSSTSNVSSLSGVDGVVAKNKEVAAVITRELAEVMGDLELSPPINDNSNKKLSMAPPASAKIKKTAAHAGVYRTPTKSVPCHTCKISFKSVLEYTHHSMQVHGDNNHDAHDDDNKNT